MWFYVQRILIGYQISDAAIHDKPRGNLSDLYPRWLGARELLLHHRDPYAPDVTREIEAGYYGRPLDPSRPSDPKDEQRFAYPVYVVFLLAPFVTLPFPLVKAAFLWLLVALTLLSVFWWVRALRWKPSLADVWVMVILTLGSFPVVQGLKLQQLTLLIAPLLAICALLLAKERYALAGFLFAIVTIKPQLTILLAAWLVLWAISDLRKRWRFLASCAATLAVLFGAGELVLPGWFPRFLHGLVAYRQYTGGAYSCLDLLLTPAIGHWAAAATLLALGVLCWRSRKASSDFPEFFRIFAAILVLTVVVVPMIADYNQVLLLPAILLILSQWPAQPRTPAARLITGIAILSLLWPWVAAFALSVVSFFVAPEVVQKAWALPVYTRVAVPLAVLTLLLPLLLRSQSAPALSPSTQK